MKGSVRSLYGALLGAAMLMSSAVAVADEAGWDGIAPDLQMLLQPVAGEWDALSEERRKRLLDMAENAAAGSSEDQAAFFQRLTEWATLTSAERDALRDRPVRIRKVPRRETEDAMESTGTQGVTPLSIELLDEGVVIGNPGEFVVSIVGGLLAIADNEFELVEECDFDADPMCEPPDPVQFPIDLEEDGTFLVPVGEDLLPPIELDFDGDTVTILFELPTQPGGGIDPVSGVASFDFDLSVKLEGNVSGVGLGNNCRIGTLNNPIQVRSTTGVSGELEGEFYDPDTSRLTLVDGEFAVPGASNCGGFLSFIVTPILNGELGLPSSSGNNMAILTVELDPVVEGPNEPPVALSQTVDTLENTPIEITLQGSDPDGDDLSFEVVSLPANGSLDTSNLPVVVYLPDVGFIGSDSFEFVVNDGTVDSEPATVTIDVSEQPIPVADPQNLGTDQNTPLNITLTATSPIGSPLTFEIVDQPVNGVLNAVNTPAVVYFPDTDFVGEDSFTFIATDGEFVSEPATVTITVEAVNNPPAADSQSVTTKAGQSVTVTLTGSDPDGDAISFAIASQPGNGTLEMVGDDQVQYTPAPGFGGQDSFTFVTNDGEFDSVPATVFVTVQPLATSLDAEPAIVNLRLLGLLTSVNLGELRATLTDENGDPVPGKELEFSTLGSVRCVDVTDDNGSAGCRAGPINAALAFLLGAGYDVSFSGDPAFLASQAHGRVFR